MAGKWSRSRRIIRLMATLLTQPGEIFSLGEFARQMDVARSTISDDVRLIRDTAEAIGLGTVRTYAGATGGVQFFPEPSGKQNQLIRETLVNELSDSSRLLPGGFLYMTDIIFSPRWAEAIGVYFAQLLAPRAPDYIVTIETKGIPIALMTARAMNRPLVIIRRNYRISEGSSVNISYVSGSTTRIQTMSLPRRAVTPGSRAVVIDDFMRGGGTVAGARDLLSEFDVAVSGVAVVVSTRHPEIKRFQDYYALVEVTESTADSRVTVRSTAPEFPAKNSPEPGGI